MAPGVLCVCVTTGAGREAAPARFLGWAERVEAQLDNDLPGGTDPLTIGLVISGHWTLGPTHGASRTSESAPVGARDTRMLVLYSTVVLSMYIGIAGRLGRRPAGARA